MTSRRSFIRTGSLAALAAGTGMPRLLSAREAGQVAHAGAGYVPGTLPVAGDPQLRELAMRALDAAKAAGASYADVRMTVTRNQTFYYANPPMDGENIAVGVRALSNGAWGFVASPEWTPDVLARLGRVAAEQARGNAWSGRQGVELASRPPATVGEWKMPVRRDPFDVAIEEKLDYIRSAEAYARTFRNGNANSIIAFERQVRVFASTDGAFYTQTVYNTLGGPSFFSVSVSDPVTRRAGGRGAKFVSPTGAGYEVFEDAKLLEQIPILYDEARQQLTATPLESPSRYEVVFDAYAMASIVNATVGAALEVDRALGFEANAAGTSYLAPVETIVGTKLAPPTVKVSANRSVERGAATVQWDDDGISPRDFLMIKDGNIADFATSREHAGTLSAWYQSNGKPVQSNGCAGSESAMTVPIVHTPNLELHPATTDTSFNDLIANVTDGMAFLGGGVMIDHQQLNGQGFGEMAYRIKKGKIVGTLAGAAYLLRSPDLWKDLTGLGGASTAAVKGITAEKGQPRQNTVHSVKAVAALFKNVRVMDIRAQGPQQPRDYR